jgi:hypothetical protein
MALHFSATLCPRPHLIRFCLVVLSSFVILSAANDLAFAVKA